MGPLVALVSAAICVKHLLASFARMDRNIIAEALRDRLYEMSMRPTSELNLDSRRTTTPPSKMHPTIVVPVLVAFGRGTPLACSAALRVWLEKSKPGMMTNGAQGALFQGLLVKS